jgi:hypothetical protein
VYGPLRNVSRPRAVKIRQSGATSKAWAIGVVNCAAWRGWQSMHALLPTKRMPRVSELGRHSEKKVSDCARPSKTRPQMTQTIGTILLITF